MFSVGHSMGSHRTEYIRKKKLVIKILENLANQQQFTKVFFANFQAYHVLKDVRMHESSEVTVKMAMSILKYFKHTNVSSDTVSPSSSAALPDPEGLLSSTIPSGVIASANKKVAEGTARKLRSMCLQMGKECQAAEYGTTTVIRYFAEISTASTLNKTTVC